jgi:hypothetical protein
MKRMELELGTWGDGTTRLSYWDSMHGLDRHFVLNPDGTAVEAKTDDEGENETLEPINLVAVLRAMVE